MATKEIWDIFSVETNAQGVQEVNIWAKSICGIKNCIKRPVQNIMWSDSWIGRWDLLADNLYGNVYLWWVVPVMNDVMNVFYNPSAGSVVNAPDRYDIWEYMQYGG